MSGLTGRTADGQTVAVLVDTDGALLTRAATATPKPVIQVFPQTHGNPSVAAVSPIACLPGTWTGEGIAYTRQWLRYSAAGVANDIPATGATYQPVAGDIGYMVSCRVTATNTEGETTVQANAVGPIVA